MASTKLMETKDGKRFFKISVSRGYGKSPYTMRWYWPDGWGKRTAERELAKQAAAFELKCNQGEILNREEERQKEAEGFLFLRRLTYHSVRKLIQAPTKIFC